MQREDEYRREREYWDEYRRQEWERGPFGSPHDQGFRSAPHSYPHPQSGYHGPSEGYEQQGPSSQPHWGGPPPRGERGYPPGRPYPLGARPYEDPYYSGYHPQQQVGYSGPRYYGQEFGHPRMQNHPQQSPYGGQREYPPQREPYRERREEYRGEGRAPYGPGRPGEYSEPYRPPARMREEERRGPEDYYRGREYSDESGQPGFRREPNRGPRSHPSEGGPPRQNYERQSEAEYRASRGERAEYPPPAQSGYGGPGYGGQGWDESHSGQGQAAGPSHRDEREQRERYQEWLRRTQSIPHGKEGERQLEGLRYEEGRGGGGDYEEPGERQPRSQRRYEGESPEPEVNRPPGGRAGKKMKASSIGGKRTSEKSKSKRKKQKKE